MNNRLFTDSPYGCQPGE